MREEYFPTHFMRATVSWHQSKTDIRRKLKTTIPHEYRYEKFSVKHYQNSVQSSIIHRSQKVEATTDDGWINKMRSSHTMDYSAIARNEVLIHATTWIKLENMLSERGQSQKQHMWFHIYEVPRIGKFIPSRLRGCLGLRVRGNESDC